VIPPDLLVIKSSCKKLQNKIGWLTNHYSFGRKRGQKGVHGKIYEHEINEPVAANFYVFNQ
jgi:hypothetical protein